MAKPKKVKEAVVEQVAQAAAAPAATPDLRTAKPLYSSVGVTEPK